MRIFYAVVLVIGLGACSKCYECTETRYVYDNNGNIVGDFESFDEVCTADKKEIDDREANGAVCR